MTCAPLALLLAASPAAAQAPAPAQAPAANPSAPGAQPGVALQVAPPTEKHVALARDLMDQIGAARMFDTFVPNMSRQITTMVTRTRPDLGPDLKTSLDA